jgi:RecB family exonuclease
MEETEFHLSYSKISTYLKCPMRYKFIYVDNLETVVRSYFSFGNSIHKVLEEFFDPAKNYKELGKDPYLYLMDLLDSHWISAGYSKPVEEKRAKIEAKNILINFYKENISTFKPAYLVEKNFSFRLDAFEVRGRIDRIDENDGKYSIIDYKTSSLLPTSFTEEEVLQPIIYRIAIEHLIPEESIDVSEVSLYFLRHQKKVSFKINDHLIDKFKRRIIEVGNRINKEEFDPDPKDNGYCSKCEFGNICPAFQNNHENL